MSWVWSITLSVFSLFFLWRIFKGQHAELKSFFLPALSIKVASGITLGLVYSYYYTVGDTFVFFGDAQKLVQLFHAHPGDYFNFLWQGDETWGTTIGLLNKQGRSLLLVKILSVVTLGSFGNYWIASVYFSIISFLGSWYALVKIQLWFSESKWAALISFFLVPSVLFWSSGIIKESICMGALMFITGIYVVINFKGTLKMWEWLVGLIAVALLWNLKYYWVALFIPSAMTTIFMSRINLQRKLKLNRFALISGWIALFSIIVLAASTLHPNFYMYRFLEVIVENNNAYTLVSYDAPFVHFNDLQPNWASIFLNSPWAMVSGLFRPFVFEVKTIFQFLISIENLVLLLLTLYNLRYVQTIWNSKYILLVASVVVYILLLAIFLTLSTPNLGTLSRYKVGFLPFLFLLLLIYPTQSAMGWIKKLKRA